eukprot:16044199-Heterocapsa_arctica.AAC.1
MVTQFFIDAGGRSLCSPGLVSLWAAHAKRESARSRSTRPSTLRTKVQGPRCMPGGSEPRYDV